MVRILVGLKLRLLSECTICARGYFHEHVFLLTVTVIDFNSIVEIDVISKHRDFRSIVAVSLRNESVVLIFKSKHELKNTGQEKILINR